MIVRSADGVIVVVRLELLFALFGSSSDAVTLAVLVTVPVVVATTFRSMIAFAPGASVPAAHVIVVVPVHVPPVLFVNDAKVTFAGSVAVTVTFVAEEGPAFTALSVYVNV